MTSNSTQSLPRLTPRVYELLRSLDIAPLTVPQLTKLSQTFSEPFSSENRTQRKLSEFRKAGWVQSFPYAIAMDGRPPKYWKLTQEGYRIAFPERRLPRRRYFEAMGIANHEHTRKLANVLVHILERAEAEDVVIENYRRENEWRVEGGSGSVYPDATFRSGGAGESKLFCLELDNGSERVETAKDVESIERKIRVYDLHQKDMEAFDPNRPLILFITTGGERRVQHILDTAGAVVSNPSRSLVFGTTVEAFLGSGQPLTDLIFLDHRLQQQSLLRLQPVQEKKSAEVLAPMPALC